MAFQATEISESFDHLTTGNPVTIPGFEGLAAYEAPLSLDVGSASLDPGLDFSVKKSPLFGNGTGGTEFDEGAYSFPLKKVSFAFSPKGLLSIQGYYEESPTAEPEGDFTLDLQQGEYITGLSGFAAERVNDLTIITSERAVHVGHALDAVNEDALGTAFSFKVPEDHMIVGFFGSAGELVNSFGVSYMRRLETIASIEEAANPVLKSFEERLYLTPTLEEAMRRGDNSTIDREKERCRNDLLPIYTNIRLLGERALVRHWIPAHQEFWYICKSRNSSLAIYTRLRGNARFIVVDSRSETTNLRSASGWIWENLDADVQNDKLSLATAKMLPRIFSGGLTTSPSAAANVFVDCLNQTGDPGAQAAARKVPQSVRNAGGLLIGGVLVNAIWSLIISVSDVVLRTHHLKVNFINLVPIGWKVVGYHGDNYAFTDGSWRPSEIPNFKPSGVSEIIPGPGGSAPGVTDRSVLGRHMYTLTNNPLSLRGVGVAMAVAREGSDMGFALKYNIRHLLANRLGLVGNIDTRTFNLKTYFEDAGSWAPGRETITRFDQVNIKGSTNALSGAEKNEYSFDIKMGIQSA